MPISFEGQVAIVTGAGQGLGRAYALDLAARGAKVVVNDIGGLDTPEGSAAQAVVREIEGAGGTALASHDSVATREGGEAIVAAALEAFGTVDAVIHNAGVWRHTLFADMVPDQLDPVLDVHLRGAFFVARPAWAVMQAKGYGRIVLTSSSTGVFGRVMGTNYAAAKAAMLGLAKGMAIEGEEHGIRVNCILPVAPFGKKGPVPETFTQQLARQGVSPEDAGCEQVTAMAVWLASRACSVSGEAFSAGGRRYGRVFIAVADGWLAPDGAPATAEDIDLHLAEIEDRSRYAMPPTSIDELSVIGKMLSARRGA